MFFFDLCQALSQQWVHVMQFSQKIESRTLPHSVFFHIAIVHEILLNLLRLFVASKSIGR